MKFSELKETITNINPNVEYLNEVDDKELESVADYSYKIFSFLYNYHKMRKSEKAFK